MYFKITVGGVLCVEVGEILLVSVNIPTDSFNGITGFPHCVCFIPPKLSTSKNNIHMGV